ncbi:hypothetical protein AB4K20DRAFT_1981199 [Rhizopus microsporus]|uniref:Uncharacterized protein n=1 Tax=Rhizopus microsporus TaxID=58291 RepID=A0A1X0RP13_RHIZD|nr:hypothetical protein BCV71DRAFT_258413 [Rhizopus microsporus]
MEINSALSVTDDETEQELTERVSCERLATEPLNFEPYGCYEALLQALNPLLTKILPVIQRDIRLRWLDKVAFEKSQGRPEAVISQLTNGVMLTWITCLFYLFSANRRLTNGDFGTSLLARFPANAAMLCCQRVSIKSVICFQIHGFAVAFCMANLSHESIYTFTKVAKAGFPRSITELPQFISMRTINQLLQVS